MKDSVMSSSVAASGVSPALAEQSRCDDHPNIHTSLTERFDILKFLGTAGNSFLFAALDRANQRPVRLKVLSDDAAVDGAQKELFYLEAAAAAKLSHQNITRASGAEELGGIHFCTVEQRPNTETLRGLLDIRSWLEIDVAVSIALQVADALDYAHRLGVLHLNLNPANILIEGDGRVLVTDFGISEDQELAWAHAARSGRHGLQYSSPEQIQGPQTDNRSDLYSLGIILFEMLTDRVPFDSMDAGVVKRKLLAQAPHPPQLFRPGISNYLSALVLTLLEKNPDWRFRTSSQLQTALSKVAPARSAGENARVLHSDDKNEDSLPPEPPAVEVATQSAELDVLSPEIIPDDAPDKAPVETADLVSPPRIAQSARSTQSAAADYSPVIQREFFEPPTITKIDPPPRKTPEQTARVEPPKRVPTARENVQPFSLYASSNRSQGGRKVLAFLAIMLVILLLVLLAGRNSLPGSFLTKGSVPQSDPPDASATSSATNPGLETQDQLNKPDPSAGISSTPNQDKVAPVKKKYVKRWRSGKASQSARRKLQIRRKVRQPRYTKRPRAWAPAFNVSDWLRPKES